MTIGSVGLMFLIACWSFLSAYREIRLCDHYSRSTTEWAWICLGLGILFTGLTVNGLIILCEEGFK